MWLRLDQAENNINNIFLNWYISGLAWFPTLIENPRPAIYSLEVDLVLDKLQAFIPNG